MRLSVAFSGFGGLADTLPIVDAAEEHGLDGVWSAEHLGFHDAVVPSALYLRPDEPHPGRARRAQHGESPSRAHRDGADVDVRGSPGPRASAGRSR